MSLIHVVIGAGASSVFGRVLAHALARRGSGPSTSVFAVDEHLDNVRRTAATSPTTIHPVSEEQKKKKK